MTTLKAITKFSLTCLWWCSDIQILDFLNVWNAKNNFTDQNVYLFFLISEFTHVMLKVCFKLAALSAEWPGRRKTYGPGETRTHDHAFRGHLLYNWATSPYWTSRLSCHLVELEVSSCLIHYCQLRVIQLVSRKNITSSRFKTPLWVSKKHRPYSFTVIKKNSTHENNY